MTEVQPASKRLHPSAPDAADEVPVGRRTNVAFGPNGQRVRSYQEEAAVPPDVRSQLENVGMRTRFNVNRGYGAPLSPLSHHSPSASSSTSSLMMNEREILQHVQANKSAFMRTQSAPLYTNELQPFGGAGIRSALITADDAEQGMELGSEAVMNFDENFDPLGAAFEQDADGDLNGGSGMASAFDPDVITTSDLKRSRDSLDDDETSLPLQQHTGHFNRLTRDLPTSNAFGPSRRMNRADPFAGSGAATMPASAGLTNYLASNSVLHAPPSSDDAPWTKHNFSQFTQSDKF